MNNLRHCCLLLLLGMVMGRHSLADQIEGKVVDASATTPNVQNKSEDPANAPRLILCTLMRGGNMKLVLVKDDGTEVKQLTDNISRDTYAAWSPDGKWIVYTSSDMNGAGLFVIDSNGEHRKRLTRGNDTEAAWSPDGKRIIFTHSIRRDLAQLFTIGVDKSPVAPPVIEGFNPPEANPATKKLSVGAAWDANAAWSPDGQKIAFDSDRSGSWRLYVMDPDGRNVRDVSQADNPGANMYPTWSPDGKRIAYTNSVSDGSRQLFVIDADGKNKTPLTKNGNFNCYATWSPDGKTIAYMSFESTKSKGSLTIMNPDGSEQKIICRDQGTEHNGRPAWKPNSK
jgi:TolB protein